MIVAFEGIDGAGKTTTGPLVAAKLRDWGVPATFSAKRAPGISDPFARQQLGELSDCLWGVPHDARLDLLGTPYWIYLNAAFFAGAHYTLSQQMAPGDIVIFDNWINKFIARICSNAQYQLADVLRVLSFVPQPDMIILLDVPPALAAERKVSASELERGILHDGRLDFIAYQNIIRDTLLNLARRYGWAVVVPGKMSPGELAEQVAVLIRARLADGYKHRSKVLE
jgi:thymidylate kinase